MSVKKIMLSLLAIVTLFSYGITEAQAGPFGDGITFKRSKSKKFRKYVKVKKKDRKANAELQETEIQLTLEKTVELAPQKTEEVAKEVLVQSVEIQALPVLSKENSVLNELRANEIQEVQTASTDERLQSSYVNPLQKINIDEVNSSTTLSKKELKQLRKEIKKQDKKRSVVSDADDGKVAAIVGYLGIIGFLISLLALHNPGNSFSAFHLRQSLGLTVLAVIFAVVGIIPILGWIVAALGGIFLFICWIIGLISAINGTQKEVPLFGGMFQNWFSGID